MTEPDEEGEEDAFEEYVEEMDRMDLEDRMEAAGFDPWDVRP